VDTDFRDKAKLLRDKSGRWRAKGLRGSAVDVLPGEDVKEVQESLRQLCENLKPRDTIEESLVLTIFDQARRMHWSKQAFHSKRSDHVGKALDCEKSEAIMLGHRLFLDSDVPGRPYGLPRYEHEVVRAFCPAPGDDERNPAVLVERLVATLPGCRWMLERWAYLRDRLVSDRWSSTERLRVIRLMGRQPLDAFDVQEVSDVCEASYALHTGYTLTGRTPPAFSDLHSELTPSDLEDFLAKRETSPSSVAGRRDAAGGRRILGPLIERAMVRLAAKSLEHEKACATETAAEQAFDEGPEHKLYERQEREYKRVILEAIDSLKRNRRMPAKIEGSKPRRQEAERTLTDPVARPSSGG